MGGETHLGEELVVIREYALDRLESKRLVELWHSLDWRELLTLSVNQGPGSIKSIMSSEALLLLPKSFSSFLLHSLAL